MKCFLDKWVSKSRRIYVAAALVLMVASMAWAGMEWKDVEAQSALEAALYRWMPMPVSKVMGLRPPREAVSALGELIGKQPTAELYSLRGLNEESVLDFKGAEADWKKYAEAAPDHIQAQLALADFYHRRLRVTDEIAALSVAARAPATANEKLVATERQRSWQAFERIFRVIAENGLPLAVSEQQYAAWIARYPQQKTIYARYFQFLLDHKSFPEAEKLVALYRTAFADDDIFPVKARALLAYRRGSVEQGLAVYDAHFQPLWPHELVQSYFELMRETRSLRKYLENARAAMEKNPNDLNAAARVFYYYQQQGKPDAAQQTLTDYRLRKERQSGKWSSEELYTLARLHEAIHAYPEAARYYYALYSSGGQGDSQELALNGLGHVLLEAPGQGLRLGAGELSMYRDIGSMDTGPGFLNGILSLVLNTTSPAYRYSEEEQRATPYFHRAEAAELIRLIDAKFPSSQHRAALHAQLLEEYSGYGESEAVIRDGQQFLATFPKAPQREQVALLMADAYAKTNRTQQEFALYDALLAEFAAKADGVPLGAEGTHATPMVAPPETEEGVGEQEGEEEGQPEQKLPQRAFNLAGENKSEATSGVRSPDYSRVLERYLSRLVSTGQLPQALAVLRKEIDRNPNDPGLYERLAQFLEQNRLGDQQEQVYQRAIQQFQDRSWYHKLARFYLRNRRAAEFETLSQQVIKIFSGTDLEKYFSDVVDAGEYHVRLNEYAHARFPHDLVFVRNLLRAYRKGNTPRWEALLREHWWEGEDLRNRFFEFLSRTGRLQQELAALSQMEAVASQQNWQQLASTNPVAARFVGEAGFWRSHFEQAAPVMGALAHEFPADSELGHRASAVYRSLAAFDPRDTDRAVAIEEALYQATPGDRDTLAHIGDIFADRELFDRAAPYWERMTEVRPGEAQAYLDPATVYWDYFNFDAALRLLNTGRERLDNPALYSYEEGAIYETKHEYPEAVKEYVNGAQHEGESSRSRYRLLDLARRPKLRDIVDQGTAALAEGATPDLNRLKLRMAVLDAQNRGKDTEQLLLTVAGNTTSLDLLEWLEQTARDKSLVAVQQAVLEREAAVTTDPVRRLELRLSLVRFYEQKKDVAAAARNVEAVYREDPKILGVVRATVDFYWRNNEKKRAIQVLLQAADNSYPTLRNQFRYEAARKSTEVGEYESARNLLSQLLKESPYNDDYLAATADTYARAGDDRGLKAFYVEHIEQFRSAALPPDARNRQIAALRRGLVPALTRLKDYAGAMDQYIEIINRFPEDDALTSEAALYAQRNGRREQLLKYYADTAAKSPRDYRWPMVLARIQTQLEDYPAAIDSFAAAIKIRPDRVDLRTPRADLLERLMRFDEACAEYQRLFDLNYHDTHWMEKIAEVRARQGRTQDTVAALQTALVDNRPMKPANYFEVARRLESWGMLDGAREFALKGVDAAGRDLLAIPEHRSGAELYARILTRLRQQDAAYQRLQSGLSDATSISSSIGVAVQQVEKHGIASVTDRQWRDRTLALRQEAARAGMAAALRSMGKTVKEYFTPEEKSAFAAALDSKAANASAPDIASFFLPAAEEAGLAEQQAHWNENLMLAHYGGGLGATYKARLVQLQSRRLRFQQLGAALERYAQGVPVQTHASVMLEAAHAYRSGGDDDAELRALSEASPNGEDQQRYFYLLLHRRPQRLVEVAGGAVQGFAYPATQYAISHGDLTVARQALVARGRSLPPVWTNAYSALAGLYLSDRSPATRSAFVTVLGDATIGERLAKRADREQQLAGNTWFYYGSRYGEWLGLAGSTDAEDFLPAILEQSPASASGYITTAQYYADAGKLDRAVQDYAHTLELAPARADIHDRLAVLYWRQQKRAEAVDEWKQALALLDAQVQLRTVPENFWPTLGAVLNHLGNRHVFEELRPQADGVLRRYIRKNGSYRVDEILREAFVATGDPQAATAWMIDLASVAPDPMAMLRLLETARWIPASERDPIYRQILARLQDRLRNTEGLAEGYAEQEMSMWQRLYARYLMGQREFDRAAAVLQSMPKQDAANSDELELRFRLAIERKQFDEILEQYRATPDKAPAPEVLRQAAQQLQRDGLRAQARAILEYVFGQEIAAHNLTAANLLGLAEIRLQDGDIPGALELLRRLTLVVGQPFENLDAAASLLARTGHHAEAAEFLAKQVQGAPWNSHARVRLTQEQLAASSDNVAARAMAEKVASDSHAPYAERVSAAVLLTGKGGPALGSGELDAIAHGALTPDTADKPYFYTARMRAADSAPAVDARVRLLENALADTPDNDSARVPLFYALISAGREQVALSAADPVLRSGFLEQGVSVASYQAGEDENAAEADTETNDTSPAVQNTELPQLPAASRAALAVAVAKAYAKLEQFETAVRYMRIAARMDVPKTTRAEINRNIADMRAAIRRNANNALRAPTIHADLVQEHLVRPKLVARAQVSARKGGRAQ